MQASSTENKHNTMVLHIIGGGVENATEVR